jgi:hypothetical protein
MHDATRALRNRQTVTIDRAQIDRTPRVPELSVPRTMRACGTRQGYLSGAEAKRLTELATKKSFGDYALSVAFARCFAAGNTEIESDLRDYEILFARNVTLARELSAKIPAAQLSSPEFDDTIGTLSAIIRNVTRYI